MSNGWFPYSSIYTTMEQDLSYVSSPSESPNVYKTIFDMLKHWVEICPDKDAFVHYSKAGARKSLSCSALWSQAATFGRYLVGIGTERGDVVGFCMSNSLTMLIAMFGVHASGGIVACTGCYVEDGSDVIEFLIDTRAKVLVIDGSHSELIRRIQTLDSDSSNQLGLKRIIYNTADAVDGLKPQDLIVSFHVAMTTCNDGDVTLPTIFPEDPCVYLETSGSSGRPKLVSHSQLTSLTNARDKSKLLSIDSKSVYFCNCSLGWSAGSPSIFLVTGCTRIMLGPGEAGTKTNIETISDIIEAEGCTHAYLYGHNVVDLLGRPDLKDMFSTVETLLMSGQRIPKLYSKVIGRYCKNLSIRYGLTETNGVSYYSSNDPDTFEDGIIGLPQPGVEMKIVDSNGQVTFKGEQGEVCTRSISRFSGYVAMAEKFHEVVDSDNWVHTSDIGHMRKDGNFVVDGRTSECITMATTKILPKDIETLIVKCPVVTSVMAVPIPDVRLNNVICACVILDKTSGANVSNVKEFCEKTWVESNPISGLSFRPAYYLEFDKFLINSNGKLDRKKMALESRKRLSL